MKMIEEHINEKQTLSLHGKLIIFNPTDLILLEGDKRYTKFFIENEEVYKAAYPLGHYSDLIEKCNLLQVHRSFFINMNKVHAYDKSDETIEMSNKYKVNLGKTYKAKFLKLLKHFPE